MLFAIDPILHTHNILITSHNDYLQLSLLTSFLVVFKKSCNQITVYLLYLNCEKSLHFSDTENKLYIYKDVLVEIE